MAAKLVCRKNKNDHNPYCIKKPCYFKVSGQCPGPLHTEPNYYSIHNCPGEPDTGGRIKSGTYPECTYCRNRNSIYCE